MLRSYSGRKPWNNDTLSLEILGAVFAYTLPDTLGSLSRNELLDLCLVCKVWRDAARMKHELWSGVKLQLNQRGTNDSACDKAAVWLKRSANAPKLLAVECNVCPDPGDVGVCISRRCSAGDPAFAKLLFHHPTLKRLSITCATPMCIENLIHSVETLAVRKRSGLRTFKMFPIRQVSLTFRRAWNGSMDSSDIFDRIPTAIIVELILPRPVGNINHDMFSQHVANRIACFSIRSYHWRLNEIGKILQSCGNLRDLTIDVSDSHYFVPVVLNNLRVDGIQLPRLQTLRVRCLSPRSMEIFDSEILRLGRLRHLDVSFEIPGTDQQLFDGKEVKDAVNIFWGPFILRHADTLQSLRIGDVNIPWAVLQSMMPRLPVLKRLVLEKVRFKAGIFRELANAATAAGRRCQWLPSLESLELIKITSMFDLDHVFSYLKARRPHHYERTVKTEDGHRVQGVGGKQVVFDGPPDSVKRIYITYRWPLATDLVVQEPSALIQDISRALRREHVAVMVGQRLVSKRAIGMRSGASSASAADSQGAMADVARMFNSSKLG